MEIEFVVRGIRERRAGVDPCSAPRAGFPGQTTQTSAGSRRSTRRESRSSFPPLRGRRGGRGVPAILMLVVGSRAVRLRLPRRSRRRAGRPSALPSRRGAEKRFTAEAARIAGRECRVSTATTPMPSPGSARMRPGLRSSPVRSPTSSPRSAGRSTGSPSRASSGRATMRRSRSPCWPTRRRTSAASATRRRPSATRFRKGWRSAGGSASTPETARALMEAQRARDLSDASVARLDYRLPPGCRERRLARPAAGRPAVPVATPFRRPRPAPGLELRLTELLLEPPPHERDTRARHLLPERRGGKSASPRARSARARSRARRARRRSPSAHVPPTPRSPRARPRGPSGPTRRAAEPRPPRRRPSAPRPPGHPPPRGAPPDPTEPAAAAPRCLATPSAASACEHARPPHRPLGRRPGVLARPPRALELLELALGLDDLPPGLGLSRLRLASPPARPASISSGIASSASRTRCARARTSSTRRSRLPAASIRSCDIGVTLFEIARVGDELTRAIAAHASSIANHG